MATNVKSNASAAGATAPAAPRQLRADAQRNRKRIIEAASDAFREHGLEVSVAEIARRAGVGTGTLFRNYPTKEDLIHAVIETRMQEWTVAAQAALEHDDPVVAFAEFIHGAAEAQYRDRGLFEAFKSGMLDAPELFECKCQAVSLSNEVLRRAQDAGAVRKDITTDDLGNLTAAAAAAADRSGASDPSVFSRYLQILMDGLKPPS